MTIRVADWILRRLADEGIRHVFMLPGGGAMYLNDAVACDTRLAAVPCHHEQACAIAAEAAGRTGNAGNPGFGVTMVTTGPGATNAITPVAGAWIDSVPMLVLSGQAKRPDRLNGRPIRQGGVQEVDIVPLVRSITKYAVTLDDPQSVRLHLEQALHLMKSGRPGPVWIDVPLDVQAAPIDPDSLPGWAPTATKATTAPDLTAVRALLAQARRPLILAGHGVRLSGAAGAFRQLVDRLQVPTVLTWNALDLLPYDHPLNIGRPGVVAARAANFAVQNCDLLIAIGARLDMIVTAYNPKGFARAARKVVVDVDPNELANKLEMAIDQPLAMDAGAFIEALLDDAGTGDTADWRARCSSWKARYTQNEGRVFPASGPIGHAHFVEALSDAAPENTLIATGSSGLAVEFFYAGFRNKAGQRSFLTSGLGAMGYGLPAAIGACLGNDRQPMLAVESDGSLQLNLQELATLAGLKLPVCLFIMNNGGYASIRNTQRNYFEGRYVGSGPASGLLMPDLEKIADTYGLPFLRIDDCADLADALARAQALPRPCLIDVRLVADESLQPKCAAIPRADGSIVSMPLEDMSPLLPLETLKAEMLVPLLPASLEAPRPV
ncbi:MAG: thiamine pyrophosphate-binding protein [Zoogloea sp.]|nr:thiamine pyrophosphate-binding protein [Zoogloea sp.]MCA0186222.1 thiamine pyrophosphate-binding protein [Pseudomonadota bacterium]